MKLDVNSETRFVRSDIDDVLLHDEALLPEPTINPTNQLQRYRTNYENHLTYRSICHNKTYKLSRNSLTQRLFDLQIAIEFDFFRHDFVRQLVEGLKVSISLFKIHRFKLLFTLNPSKSSMDTTSVFRGPMCRVGNSLLFGKISFTVANARIDCR